MREKIRLFSFEMKWYILMHCHVLLLIFLGCFSPTNALPVQSNSTEIYGKDIRGNPKDEWNPPPKEGIEEVSEDCLPSEGDNEINLPDETPKATGKRGLSSSDKTPKKDPNEGLKDNADNSNVGLKDNAENPHEGLKDNANLSSGKILGWITLIYPGTKWCGDGNIASSYDDLGPEEEADKCCRTHDNCQDFILGGETKYNLTNKSKFTSLSCECDKKLYECLKQANTSASHSIGSLYFNFFKRSCFSLDHQQKCKKYETSSKNCSEFESDTSMEKVYQWMPPKQYKKL